MPCRLIVADRLEDLLDQHRGQPHRRLVQQQQARPGHEGAADGQHLLLAAREGARHLDPMRSWSRGKSANTRSMSAAIPRVGPQVGAHLEVLGAR